MILFLFGFTSCNPFKNSYTRNIMDKYTEDISLEGFKPIGSNLGSNRDFPDINELKYYYKINRKVTVSEAREILVLHVEDLLKRINNDYDIRPYLYEYPFKSKYITLGFKFKDENGNECKEPYVADVTLMSDFFDTGFTNHVVYTFRNSETGVREGKYHDEKYSEAKAIYKELYCNESNLENNP